jgi:diguanylate cyclase (GGDEF)-like protein
MTSQAARPPAGPWDRIAATVFLSRAERSESFEVRLRLAEQLHNRISNVLMVGLAGLLSGAFAYARDRQALIFAVASLGFCFVLIRAGMIKLFQRRLARRLRVDPDQWTSLYGFTASASSACWGFVSFACLAWSDDPVLYLASVVCNTATAGAVAARNAAAPRLARIQLITSLIPIMAGAGLADAPGYSFLILVVPCLIFGLFVVIRESHGQLVALYASQLQLMNLSNTDHLTQIPNRRYFGECCDETLARQRHTLAPFTILMIDVDYFKGYNDFYGHPAGDVCLQKIAQLLKSSLRHADSVVSRYGGEEFAVLLRETDTAAGQLIAQRLCDAVAQAAIPHENRKDQLGIVTVSVGAAAVETLQQDYDRIIKSADLALYEAKTLGRNRICAAAA